MIELDEEKWSAQLGAVIEQVRPQLARLLGAYRIPAVEAEDLVQDALLGLVANWPDVREPCSYLVGATRHLCRFYVRQQIRQRARIALTDPDQLERLAGSAPSGQDERDALADVERLVRTLGPRPRRLLRLRPRRRLQHRSQVRRQWCHQRRLLRQHLFRCTRRRQRLSIFRFS